MFNTQILAGSSGQGGGFYPVTIDDSLRFEDGGSAYLNRTPASAGNLTTWTWSGWVKRGNLINGTLFSAGFLNQIIFETDRLYYEHVGVGNYYLITTNKLRDTSAWYHLVFVWDTSNATSTDRMRIYINGERVTAFDSAGYPVQNEPSVFNSATTHEIGHRINPALYYLDGYLSDVYFIDGQALDASSFGEAKDGVWIPKSYSGSYGTNGFHLDFNGNTNDTSGNGNNWTANNISAHDYVPDSPTNNFATMNSIAKKSTVTLSEGNLKSFSNDASIVANVEATFGISSGKWYFEASGRSGSNVGYPVIYLADATTRSFNNTNYTGNGCSAYGAPIVNGSLLTRVASLSLDSTSDVRQFAFDFDDGKMWIGKNGTWYDNSGTSFTNSTGPESGNNFNSNSGFTYDVGKLFSGHNDGNCAITFNFGQDSTFSGARPAGGNQDANNIGDFAYAPPSGFLSLCSASLPTPTIIDGSEHFNTVLWTGDATFPRNISGVGFDLSTDGGLVWIKNRSIALSHTLWDSVRGAGANKELSPNNTTAEGALGASGTTADYGYISSLTSDGFDVAEGATGYESYVNASGNAYAAWNWKAGGTAVSNTDGSITSQVSANVDAGFSIVSYTGNGTAGATIGHGLSSIPDMVILKSRSDTSDWWVAHSGIPNNWLQLDDTQAAGSGGGGSGSIGHQNGFTTTVFDFEAGSVNMDNVNKSGSNYIAYCFANSDIIKAGSYIGNGSTDGTFVYTGFRPAWLMIKETTNIASWYIQDSTRDVDNPVQALYPIADNSLAEISSWGNIMDLVSNGFKPRVNDTAWNRSGGTYIYLAFAETPFKYANAR